MKPRYETQGELLHVNSKTQLLQVVAVAVAGLGLPGTLAFGLLMLGAKGSGAQGLGI